MTPNSTTLTRAELRAIFKRNRGAARRLAAELGLAETTMSKWLKGKVISARIASAAQSRGLDLLREEAQRRAA